MATRLKQLKIDRVDLVDRGANQDAMVVLFKRETPPGDDLSPLLTTFVDKAGRVIAGARLERLKQAVQVLQRICDEAEPSTDDSLRHDPLTMDKGATRMAETLEDVTKRATAAEAEVVALTKRATDAETEAKTLQDSITTLEKHQTELEAELAKAQPADPWQGISSDVRKRIEASEERMAKAETEVRKRDCITQVRKYDALPLNPDDHWAMFDALNALPDDVRKHIFTLLDSCQERFTTDGVMKQQGSRSTGTGGGTDAWSVIQTKAKDLVSKGVVKTMELGVDRVMQDEPDLYIQYEQERRGA